MFDVELQGDLKQLDSGTAEQAQGERAAHRNTSYSL